MRAALLRLVLLLVLLLPVVLAACPGPRALDGLECDKSGACATGYVCSEGICHIAGECGDGTVNVGEQCDGTEIPHGCGFGTPGVTVCTDACEIDYSDCQVGCGDGQRHDTEVCDDNNTADDDLCSADCGTAVVAGLELEPNDDGSPSAEDDFLASAATGPVTTDTLVAGTVDGGDQDVWLVELASAARLTLSLHNRSGIGRCDISANVRVRDANGAVLFDVNRGAGSGCPLQTFELEAGRALYVEVYDNDGGDHYLLGMDFTP